MPKTDNIPQVEKLIRSMSSVQWNLLCEILNIKKECLTFGSKIVNLRRVSHKLYSDCKG